MQECPVFQDDTLAAVLRREEAVQLTRNLPTEGICAVAGVALSLCPYAEGAVRKWHIYTDGAFVEGHDERAALAFVVVAELEVQPGGSRQELAFQGAVGAKVRESLAPSLQEGGYSATMTEMAAALWAVLWCLSLDDEAEVEITTDSANTLAIAQGQPKPAATRKISAGRPTMKTRHSGGGQKP